MHPFTEYTLHEFEQVADPEKAPEMQAYMKTDQMFYGIPKPIRYQTFKQAKQLHPILTFDDYETVISELWEGESREEMYQALEVAQHYKKFRTNSAWLLYVSLMRSATNWDTLDLIAANLIGDLVNKHRDHEKELLEWREDSNFWVRRASLLAHLKHKQDTNLDLLSDTILMLMHESEFFIRKAIGWVLREYSKIDPQWVEQFVETYQEGLSGLSKREALKHINRQRT